MPRTAPHGRWATCVQLVYTRWFPSGKTRSFIHPASPSLKAVGKNWWLSPKTYPACTLARAQLLYAISSVTPDLSTLYTELTITTTTYIKYRSIGI